MPRAIELMRRKEDGFFWLRLDVNGSYVLVSNRLNEVSVGFE